MNLPDYYAILRVAPTADLEAIKRAYRKRATECHPDHGGDHREMAKVNEAWFILSDPEKRRQYDAARSAFWDPSAQAEAEKATQEARDFAEQYPRQWAEFSAWLDRVTADFSGAQYGTTSGPKGIVYPTAQNSVSATLFIVGGGLIGAVFGLFLLVVMPFAYGTFHWFSAVKGVLIGVPLFAAAGAWLGRIAHAGIASVLKPGAGHPQPGQGEGPVAAHRILSCPACGQKLRLPVVDKLITATCPKCQQRFDVPA